MHVTNSLQGYRTSVRLTGRERSLRVANGVEVGVEAIGLVPLVLNNGFVIELKNVFYVPSVKRNLISVTLLDNDGYSCNFGDGKCLISFNNNVVGHAF